MANFRDFAHFGGSGTVPALCEAILGDFWDHTYARVLGSKPLVRAILTGSVQVHPARCGCW